MSVIELIATDRPSFDAVRESLEGWFNAQAGDSESFERIYYDTFDGLLYEAGLTLALEHGQLVLTQRDGQGDPLTAPFPEEPQTPLRLAELEAGPLLAALERVVGVRVLLEIARIELSTETLVVLDELEKTVVRIAAESHDGLPGRVRVSSMRGYEREYEHVVELLLDAPDLVVADELLVDEAVRAGGGQPAGVRTEINLSLQPSDPADEAVVRILTRLIEVREANLPGVLEDVDTEFLHDYRVSLRRTRAVVREMKGVFPSERLNWIRAQLKWLQTATGETRDLDVYLQEFEDLRKLAPEALRGDLDPLLEVLSERHLRARMAMVRDLRSERARALQLQLAYLLEHLVELPVEDRPDAKEPVEALASKRIRKVHRKMVRMGRGIDPSSPPSDYHELRKKGKELRYLLELFGRPLHDPDVVKPMIRALKGLQDVLGRHQDREVQIDTLRSLAEEVARQPGGPSALMAMGAMIEHLEQDAAAAREEFHGRFKEFASAEQRRLVMETFSP